MKKHILLITNLRIAAILVAGICTISFLFLHAYKKVVIDCTESACRLAESDIYAGIKELIQKPRFIAEAMADDALLMDLLAENDNDSPITDYLQAIDARYSGEQAETFLISSASNAYFTGDGYQYTMRRGDAQDAWFYDFIDSGANVSSFVRPDTNTGEESIFVFCRVSNEDAAPIGVTGIRIPIMRIRMLLTQYVNDYDLQASLTDKSGDVRIDASNQTPDVQNVFDIAGVAPLEGSLFQNTIGGKLLWITENNTKQCLMVRYMPGLDWYLVVIKDTVDQTALYRATVSRMAIIMLCVIVLVLLLVTTVISRFNKHMIDLATTDDLSGLHNRAWFDAQFFSILPPHKDLSYTLFILDIDYFKHINDAYGHLTGNRLIRLTAKQLARSVGRAGHVARWGGDEFVGLLRLPQAEAELLLEKLRDTVAKASIIYGYPISISVGASHLTRQIPLAQALALADTALYLAKSDGRNCVRWHNDEPTADTTADTL